MPLALVMFQCLWHYHHFHCTAVSILSSGFWCHSLSRLPACLGDDLGTSHLVVGFLLVFLFPLQMEWILATQATVPPTVDWAESSCPPMVCYGMVHCLMSACRLHCNCHTFTAVLFLREINFHMTSCISCWPANMC